MAISSGGSRSKVKGAPDYDEAAYWDTKFATGQDVGEWLNSGDVLLEAILTELEQQRSLAVGARPRVLHLGPGISKLGTKLCEAFVERGWSGDGIVNVDFSSKAVQLGQEVESKKDSTQAMHWRHADLRSWEDLSTLSSFAPFDVILDKGTSDALATSPPQNFSSLSDTSPGVCPTVRETLDESGETTLYPVELLALHLVPLTQKGTIWVVLSFSTSRFDNFSHLERYWSIVSRTKLEAPPGPVTSTAYAPRVFHGMYILRRK